MADHYFGVDRGVQSGFKPSEIQQDTSTTSADLELRIGDSFGWTRKEVVHALEALERLFSEPGGSPGGSTFPPI